MMALLHTVPAGSVSGWQTFAAVAVLVLVWVVVIKLLIR